MTAYTRQSTYTDGDVITAAHTNDEFDRLVTVFNNTAGHSHDGTAGEGPVIGLIGDANLATPLNKIVVDTANDQLEFSIDVSGVSTEQLVMKDGVIEPTTTNDIDLGATSKQFKDLYLDGTATIDGLAMPTTTVTDILDEDTMTSDSATALATQQSIKAYVDAQVTAQDLDFQGDSGGALNIDLDSETLTVAGGTGIDTTGSGNTLTIDIDSTVATLTGSQTLTNKTLTTPVISSISNTGTVTLPTSTDTLVGRATTDTLTNKTLTSPTITTGTLNGAVSGTSIKDEDGMTSDSASHLATQQSIKAYVDNEISGAGVPSDTDGLSEGSTNLYFTNTRADARITNAVGTSVQAYDAGLTSIAGLTTSADKIIYTSASDTYAVTDFTAFGRSLVDDADASAGRTTLGLGTAATQDVGTTANDVVQLDGSSRLPAVDGSQLTNLPSSGISDVVDDTTPQLGGDLDTNGNDINFGDNDKAIFGAGNDLQIYHSGTGSVINEAGTGNLTVNSNGTTINFTKGFTETLASFNADSDVELFYDNSKKFETSATGVTVTGTVAATAVTGDGSGLTNLPASGDGGIAMAIALG